MENIKTIKCTVNDWEMLQHISVQTFSDSFRHKNTPENFDAYTSKAFSEDQIKNELQNPNSHFYYFHTSDVLAGYIKLNEENAQTEKQGDDVLEIERIYLYKKYQGKGHGKSMIDFVVKLAKEMGKPKIWLGVWEENHSAIAFYKKMGFVEFGKHKFTIGDDVQTDLLMELVFS